MAKQKIMVVDDNVPNLNVARKALEDEYEVFLTTSGEKALKGLPKILPDLILLDVEMPGMNGFEVIEEINKLGAPYDEIPVIFLTAKDDLSSEYEGLDLGAVDYIIKPFPFSLLKKRVAVHLRLAMQQKVINDYSSNLKHMVESQVETIKELQYAVVYSLGNMVERRDGTTGDHLIRTTEYLKILLIKAKERDIYDGILRDAPILEYAQASQLHDIGKIAIPDGVLLKEGKLTDAEYEMMKLHTTIGEEAIAESMKSVKDSAFLDIIIDFIGSHHEKWDGTGYPRGLKGTEIPICGRLMAIADVYDALISPRSYKPAFAHEKVLEIMYDGDGTHFDPVLMSIFRDVHNDFKAIAEKYKDVKPEPSEKIDDIR